MLMGASVYSYESEYSIQNKRKITGWFYVIIFFVLLIVYYGYQILMNNYSILKDIQIVLLPVLMSITYMIYKICSNLKLQNIYQSNYVYWAVYGVSACCLEIYLSGKLCFWLGKSMINYFPFNVVITFIFIFLVAYCVKIFSNFLAQTFKTEPYEWGTMLRL